MKEKKMIYTDDEQITRIWDVENVRHTMNRQAYYLSNADGRRAINELWVQEPDNRRTASYGVNTGYYKGIDEVARHMVIDANERAYENLKARAEENPALSVNNKNLGYGCSSFMTVTTPVIKISDDGRYAQFMGFCPGFVTEGKPKETAESYFLFGRVMADLVKEKDGWKIWHYIYANDHSVEVGTNYADFPVKGWPEPIADRFGKPTEERTVYDGMFGWEFCATDMPKENYVTYCDKDGYGPDSDIGRPYYER
jgi:hypothetical protein